MAVLLTGVSTASSRTVDETHERRGEREKFQRGMRLQWLRAIQTLHMLLPIGSLR